MASEWYDPTEAEISKLTLSGESLERAVYVNETEEQMARRIFREALPTAARAIADISRDSTNDRTRLDASKYIVERNLGKVGDDAAHVGDNALAKFAAGIEEELRKSAQNGS